MSATQWNYPGQIYEKIRAYHRRSVVEVSFFKSLGLTSGNTVLDLGCGTGTLARLLAQEGARVKGVDSSHSFLSFAKELSEPNCSFVQSKVEDYLDEDRYDYVICTFSTVCYLPSLVDVVALFRKVRGWLNPSGKFVCEIPYLLNYIESYKPSEVLQVGDNKLRITRLISHRIDPHYAYWQHEETLMVKTVDEAPVQMYTEQYKHLIISPPMLEYFLEQSGFSSQEYFTNWSKSKTLTTGSTCIVVAA